MSSVVKRKPPLPVALGPTVEVIEDGVVDTTLSRSIDNGVLKTSQQETISDGTILGLNDVIYQNEPDLTYYCSTCKRFITLLVLKDHKAYHNALNLLEFSQLPVSSKILLTKRNQLLKTLKEDAVMEGISLDLKSIQLVDDAYELLKQELEDTFESCRKIDEKIRFQVQSSDLSCSLDFVSSVGHCSDRNARWKSTMEDSKVYQDYFGNDRGKAYIGLYDGYNGRYAAAVAANELHYLLLREIAKFDHKISCKCTFNMFEENDISQYDLIRPPNIPCGHKREIHRDSGNSIYQTIYTCEALENDGTNHLSSHHPIIDKPTNEEEERDQLLSSRTPHKTKDEYCQHMKAAFRNAYKLADKVLSHGGDEKSRVRWSGCSSVTVVLEQVDHDKSALQSSTETANVSTTKEDEQVEEKDASSETKEKTYDEPYTVGRIHLANTGNCHAVLVRDNRSYLLTKAHTYENNKERNRIINLGGVFSQSEREMRVNGVSLTTRGLGNHGDPAMKELISWEPYCTTVPVDQYAQLLIIATHGVWQVFSPQEAAELLLQILPQNRIPTPGIISPSVDMLKSMEPIAEEHQDQLTTEKLRRSSHFAHDDEFADEVIPLPPDDLSTAERKSSLPAPTETLISSQRSKNRAPSVTFKVGTGSDNPVDAVEEGEIRHSNTDFVDKSVNVAIADEEEDDELREIRSDDSGNEGDVDTDWASTVPPNDLALRSALSSRGNAHRQLSRVLSERLVQSALLAGAKDNISAVVVLLPGTKVFDSFV